MENRWSPKQYKVLKVRFPSDELEAGVFYFVPVSAACLNKGFLEVNDEIAAYLHFLPVEVRFQVQPRFYARFLKKQRKHLEKHKKTMLPFPNTGVHIDILHRDGFKEENYEYILNR